MNGPDLVRDFNLSYHLSQYFFLKIWYIITEELKAGICIEGKERQLRYLYFTVCSPFDFWSKPSLKCLK
jgi:hypothetical protein